MFANSNPSNTQLVISSFQKICQGGSNEEIAAAKDCIEKLKLTNHYIPILIELLSSQNTENGVKTLSAIELKNSVLRKLEKSSENLAFGSAEESLKFNQTILQIYYNETHAAITKQLSLVLAASFSAVDEQLMGVANLIRSKLNTANSLSEETKTVCLLHDLCERLRDNHSLSKLKCLSREVFEDCAVFWKKWLERIFVDSEANSIEISLLSTKTLKYIVCFGIDSEEICSSKSIQYFFLTLLNALKSFSEKYNVILQKVRSNFGSEHALEDLFRSLVEIFALARSKYPFEILPHLAPFLDFSINHVISGANSPENVSLGILKLINDVVCCREYRPSHCAAFTGLRKGINKQIVLQSQSKLAAFFERDEIQKLLAALTRNIVRFTKTDFKKWLEDPEGFYSANFAIPYENSRSVALRILEEYAFLHPAKAAVFAGSLLNSVSSNKSDFPQTSESAVQRVGELYALFMSFAVMYCNVKGNLQIANFSMESWMRGLEDQIKNFDKLAASPSQNLNSPLKLAFCQTTEAIFRGYRTPTFAQSGKPILSKILFLLADNNPVVSLYASKCLSQILETAPNRSIFDERDIGNILKNSFSLFMKLQNSSLKLIVLKAVAKVVSSFDQKTKPFYGEILHTVKTAWSLSLSGESALRLQFLDVLIELISIRPDCIAKEEDFLVKVLSVSTAESDSNLTYLNERGFDLFSLFLVNASSVNAEISRIFGRSFGYFARDRANLSVDYGIIGAFLLLDQRAFFQNHIQQVEELIWSHLNSLKRHLLSPVLDCLTLMVRVLKSNCFKIDRRIFQRVLLSVCSNPNFSNSTQFRVSSMALDIFSLLLIHCYAQSIEFFAKIGQNALLQFLRILVDSFERVPMISIKRNFAFAICNCLETRNAEVIRLIIEPLLRFCVEISVLEGVDGISPTLLPNKPSTSWTHADRNLALLQGEENNFANLKSVVINRIAKCCELNGKTTIENVLKSVPQTVRDKFEHCK